LEQSWFRCLSGIGVPGARGGCRRTSAQNGEIAGGQNRSPREELVLGTIIGVPAAMSCGAETVDDEAFHDVSAV
jgi:hypothetical protein